MPGGRPDDEVGIPGDSGEPGFPGRDLLRGTDVRDVLRKLHEGDPLEVFARCRERIEREAYLLQVDRLYLRTIARMAYAARTYGGEPSLGEWIGERMTVSMRELLNEDREAERVEFSPGDDSDDRLQFLSQLLGVELGLTRRVCNEFNVLPKDLRSSAYAVLVRGLSIDAWAKEGGIAPDMVKRQLRKAFWRIGVRRDIDILGYESGQEEPSV